MPSYAFIWDLDGTLIDSYPAIVPSTLEICRDLGLSYTADYVRGCVLRGSVRGLLKDVAAQLRLDPEPLWERYNELCDSRIDCIQAIPHALEALQKLCAAGWPSFIYTHRGASSLTILERTGLAPCFTEVLTALSGFPRKPDPTAIRYLLDRHGLDPDRTYYVGDRSLDVEAAVNAGIRSILYLEPSSPAEPTGQEDHIVSDLAEIAGLFSL